MNNFDKTGIKQLNPNKDDLWSKCLLFIKETNCEQVILKKEN